MMIPISAGSYHIGMIVSSLGLLRGGMETRAVYLARGLAARGHQVTLVVGRGIGTGQPVSFDAAGLQCIRVACVPANGSIGHVIARRRPGAALRLQSRSFAFAARLYPSVRYLVATADVTLTFLEVETAVFSTWRGHHGRPNVSYFPGGIDWHWLRRDRSVVRLANSPTVVARYRGVPDFRIDGVTWPGVGEEWLDQAYLVAPIAQTLVFVGRLEANKGVMDLLDMFQALHCDFPGLKLRLLGDGQLRPLVESTIQRCGLDDCVACLGAVPASSVLAELRQADLFVFPSRYESLPMAVLEAQAVGVPVVASDIAGIREAAGDAARYVSLEDRGLWLDALRSLVVDADARRNLSRAGRERAKQFTWRAAVEDLEEYLRLAVDRCST